MVAAGQQHASSWEELHPLARLPEEWEAWAKAHGEPAFRGRQLFRWLHHRLEFRPEAMSDLPKRLRSQLEQESVALPFTIKDEHASEDTTRKLLLRLGASEHDIETVLIPQLRERDPDVDDDADDVLPGRVPGHRVTQCISSQVGCAMGCVFCASGLAGLKRSLRPEEIAGQVLLGRARLRALTEEGETPYQLTNVVFMGMGEPLHNYEAVSRALRLLTHEQGLALSYRRVTVSTSGLVPEIDRLGREFGGRVQLALSLHAANDARRSELMPINRRYPLRELVAALRRYPLPKRRRITVEYTLIRGVNDSVADARELSALLDRVPIKINLIPMNPVAETPLEAPDYASVARFRRELQNRGLTCLIRTQRGDEITAACGQLALLKPDGERMPVRIRRKLSKGGAGQ